MNKRILFGQIVPAQLMFDPPVGNGQGEGGTGASNQQQQQQAPTDPFADVDLDLLPENAREAIKQSRSTLQSLQSQNVNAQQFQTRAQQLEAELNETRAQLARSTPPQSGTKPEPTTQEAKLEAYYIANGLPEAQAKSIAKMNKGAFEIFAEGIKQEMGQQFSPIAGQVIANTAEDAFHSAAQNDKVGWTQIPEIQQQLWDRVQQMAKAGQMVNPQVAENLAKIFWYDHQSTGQQTTSVVPFPNQQNTPHSIPNMGNQNFQQQSRFSFPGAGSVNTPRNQGNGQSQVLDAETQAAINATTGSWAPELQTALRKKQGAR